MTDRRTLITSYRRPLIVCLVMVAAVGLLFFFSQSRESAFPPVPNPNGYDVLLRTSAKIVLGGTNAKDMTTNVLADLIAQNEAALKELRQGLGLPTAVPVEMNPQWIGKHMANLSTFKAAALAMDAEALLLHQNGNASGALIISLDSAKFSQAFSRRGLLITALVGTGCENIAIRRITNLLAELSVADCKRTARALHEVDSKRESFADITRRELEWSQRTYGFLRQMLLMIQARSFQPAKAVAAGTDKKFERHASEVRRVMLEVASRGFELEHGRKPERVSELVPEFLPAVPPQKDESPKP